MFSNGQKIFFLSYSTAVTLFTYCSPAFWPQSQSEGSEGSAGPQEEEVEEPQTLEQPGEDRGAETQKPVMGREDDRNTESAKQKNKKNENKLLSINVQNSLSTLAAITLEAKAIGRTAKHCIKPKILQLK